VALLHLSRHAGAAGLVLLLGSLAAGCTAARPVHRPPHPVVARPAEAFLNSVGVNVHFGVPNSVYAHRRAIIEDLVTLGVRHVRDSLPVRTPPNLVAAVRELNRRGIGTDLVIGSAGVPSGGELIPVDHSLAELRATGLLPALDSVEGPNEWDLRGGSNWLSQDASYQRALFAAFHPLGIPVLSPSVPSGLEDPIPLVRAASPRNFDGVSIHSYPGTSPPEDAIDSAVAGIHETYRRLPVYLTETGYLANPRAHGGVSPAAAAVYLPRALAEAFADGVVRTYLYQAADYAARGPQSAFGLMTSTLHPRPAYPALRRLLALLGTTPTGPSTLRIAVNPDGAEPVHSVLLHKSAHQYLLLLWRANAVSTTPAPVAGVADSGGTERVSLDLPTTQIKVFRPTLSGVPAGIAVKNGKVDITLAGDLTVVAMHTATP
jgi:hypothetical protein